ncbi:hypothetical protein SKAU_G00078330 [Synaphobranchus kaupii]|uniref:Uncharacterized protein n=1 Tax=Synaphobranchus kaupii TaxID=118154 RepID=A0A9Q1FU75_SYNKA|nr:hypothetical protein SKAU_G00078330 [Synaphobranchus kaupii]
MEIEAAKVDGDLPGLSYLNTARGVNPIVQKLPYSLQDRWLSVGSNYKQQHCVAFPPFSVFVDFISQQARIRNDPSFNLTGPAPWSKATGPSSEHGEEQDPTPSSEVTAQCTQSLDGKLAHALLSLLECNEIPNHRVEIPTPSAALHYAHLNAVAHLIPELEPTASIMLLLGRGVIRLHKRERPTCSDEDTHLGCAVFQLTNCDNKNAPSIENIAFIEIMERGLKKDDSNSWVALLPFRMPRRCLPDNRVQALNRLSSLRRSLDRKPEMRQHFFSFMKKIFENNHAEVAPPLKKEELWYLPTFGVYHPKKPINIQVVFDSSAQHNGVSLKLACLKKNENIPQSSPLKKCFVNRTRSQ